MSTLKELLDSEVGDFPDPPRWRRKKKIPWGSAIKLTACHLAEFRALHLQGHLWALLLICRVSPGSVWAWFQKFILYNENASVFKP